MQTSDDTIVHHARRPSWPFDTDHWDETMRDLILDSIYEFGRTDIPRLLGRIRPRRTFNTKSAVLMMPRSRMANANNCF